MNRAKIGPSAQGNSAPAVPTRSGASRRLAMAAAIAGALLGCALAAPANAHPVVPPTGPAVMSAYSLSDVSFYSATNGWVLGPSVMLHTTNGGAKWTKRGLSKWLPQPYTLHAICATGKKKAWLVADNGIFHTRNAGKTWKRIARKVYPTPTYDTNWRRCAFVNDRTGWISGGATIIYTNNGGKSWSRQAEANSTTSGGLTNIAPIDATRAFAGMNATGGHVVIGIGMGGAGWTQLGTKPFLQYNEFANPTISGAAATSPDTFWVAAVSGEVFRSLNQGVAWSEPLNPAVGTNQLRSQGVEAVGNSVISFGSDGAGAPAAVASVDGGNTWQWSAVAPGTASSFADVDLVNPMLGWAVAGTSILRTLDGGQSWQQAG